MGNLLKWLAGALAGVVVAPFVAKLLSDVGVDPSTWSGPLAPPTKWLIAQSWFVPAACLLFGLALGAWASTVLQRFDRPLADKRSIEIVQLGTNALALRQRMIAEYDEARAGAKRTRPMTLMSTEYLALQLSLHRLRIPVLDHRWLAPDAIEEFLTEAAAYLTMVGELLKAGHVREARVIARRLRKDHKASRLTPKVRTVADKSASA
jgi:hypothetical protein